jgi:gamma-glutamylputrescine oxidase
LQPYPETHYAATRTDDALWPGLDGDCEVETCVIGGGLAGLATALGLAERGRSVVLLEANRLGWGASGRNGGFASAGYPLSMRDLVAQHGLADASALWRLSADALAVVKCRAEALGPETLQGHGALRCRVAWQPDTLGDHVDRMNAHFDAGLVHLPPRELRDLLVTEAYADGFLNPASLQIQPLNLARGMAHAAVAAGAQLHEGVEVAAIEPAGAARKVVTRSGSVVARHVVLAGGAHLGMLHTGLGLATVPVASFVVATKSAPEQLREVIRTGFAVSDTRVATDYYRVLTDGRLLWGGRANAFEYTPEILRALLKGDIARIYPQLANLEIESAWSGLMPIARHRMPVIGPLAEGLWAAACFGGLGLVNTTLAGELIASAIAEGDDRHRHFAPFGLPFAGGTFGRAAFQFIYWRHQFEDWLKRPKAGRAGDQP